MPSLADLLDADTARRPSPWRLVRELWSLLAEHPAPPQPASLPQGDGAAVLVVPAFLTGDVHMRGLRAFLSRCGFQAFGWGLGINWGPTPRILDGLERRLDGLHRDHGPVAVVGVSLGGVLARNLAYDRPGSISHVVTLASPFRLPVATTIGPLVRLCAWRYSPAIDPARLRLPLPVPSTMICTRDDGVVDWQACRTGGDSNAIVMLDGAHLTIARRPAALRAIVERLAGSSGTGQ